MSFDHIVGQADFHSPLGRMLMARDADGICGIWFEEQKYHPGALQAPRREQDPWLQQTAQLLTAYFAGSKAAFSLPPLSLRGTEFQRAVWRELLAIPSGSTLSYGTLARRLGRPEAVRAAAAAVGRNPVSVLVPCHRVIGGSGQLTGYAGGLERKRALLALEASEPWRSSAPPDDAATFPLLQGAVA